MSRVFTIVEGLENLGALKTGGQGSVYKGRRQASIYTAVKLLPTPVYSESGDDKNFRNFQSEVQKLQKVNEQASPYVVKILSSGLTESGSFPFIEMEYIEGPDLCELLQPPHPKVFPLREAIKVADQLASALAHCHRVGVRHGDVKSNNVRYNTKSGNYMLLDFGLALMTQEERRTSIRHAGAIEFMAPEQSRGEMLPQTDVYSYGVVLYEILTGQVPFPIADHQNDTSRNQVMLQHMEAPIPDLLELRRINLPQEWSEELKEREAIVPAWLIDVVYRCLQKEPANRFADAIALQEAVASGSLSSYSMAGESVIEGGDTIALQQENERLKELVSQYQVEQQERERERISAYSGSGMYISKPVFTGLVALLLVFMIFSGYALFYKKHDTGPVTTPGIDSVASSKPTDSTIQAESNYNTPERDVNRNAAADSLTNTINQAAEEQRKEADAARLRRKQQQDSIAQAENDTTNNTPPDQQ